MLTLYQLYFYTQNKLVPVDLDDRGAEELVEVVLDILIELNE